MALPNEAYVSNAVPYGGLQINIYRTQAAPALLGAYKLESMTLTENSVMVDRPDIDGGDNGFVVVRGQRTGSGVIQLAVDSTTTLQVGDFFDVSIRRDANGNAVTERIAITSVGDSVEHTGYRKQNVNLRVDLHP